MIEVNILLIFKSHTAITYGQRNVTRASSLLSGTIKLNVTTRHLRISKEIFDSYLDVRITQSVP